MRYNVFDLKGRLVKASVSFEEAIFWTNQDKYLYMFPVC